LLAKLFAKSANLLVMDEPTNDLDSETLELLEQRLVAYDGTVLLVSHDRAFLNNVVGSTIVFEGDQLREYVGGYDDWVRQRQASLEREAEAAANGSSVKSGAGTASNGAAAGAAVTTKTKKLSFKDQRELQQLPGRIESLEAKIAALHEEMAQPGFFKQTGGVAIAKQAEEKAAAAELKAAYARWEELEQSGG
jgi:ATP-binding cassette subfamily F protein uup